MGRTAVVTGGSGFIGAYLVKRLVSEGWTVSVVDTMVRGDAERLADVAADIRFFTCDVRDEDALTDAFAGADVVMHLAAINGTENFYKHPELVLDVGLRGALAVVNAGKRAGVPDLVVASSAEAYQSPDLVPTPETVALTVPDPRNPRYSYGGSKIISELIAFNYARDHYRQVQVFRPHNVYGPDMGWKHVIPQFITRAAQFIDSPTGSAHKFEIQGDGSETRAFCYVDDIVSGILTMYAHGADREIYHIGNDEEVTIRDLALRVGDMVGVDIDIVAGPEAVGGTRRRCPDISKMRGLGYTPTVDLDNGLRRTTTWYREHAASRSGNALL
jgi:UDP-glucose 4-epimerase